MSFSEEKKVDVELNQAVSRRQGSVSSIADAVFGEVTEKGPNYRNVGWLGTAFLMMKTQIGLGVLSIPLVFNVLGLVPGVICLLIIAVVTTWSDYVVGTFKINHPEVYGIDDVGRLIAGPVGYWLMSAAFCLYFIFVAGSAMLSISIALNALSLHGTCTAVFVAVAAILAALLASIQTLGRVSWLAWVGVLAILVSIFTLTISVGVEARPADAPVTPGPWKSDFKIIGNPSFTEAAAALSSLVFAYAGTPAFFSIISEMRDPRKYTRSLVLCQSVVTLTYLVIGIVVYYYCGSYVSSPALGSAGVTMKRICYGLALPGLAVSMILYTHLCAKYIFIRLVKGTRHLASNTPVHWIVWISCTTGTAIVSYVIASGIPVFGGLVSLIGALFGTLLSFQLMGCMWLYDNWGVEKAKRTTKWKLMVCWSVFVVVSGTFLMIAGIYGSIVGIMDSYKATGGSAAWSCADNSGSV
ncbi:hypothetical protein LTR62_008260 [Meristemomyces frigidus]|uniref:Amino acid transporter transmembrane domain-containing protein n=1 Tax=Meristemomyces frigidus TaxID=1508187 RepID=A0AAN7TA64_9PEZI|nr:hypothetical protein LTR62_008260 [Meristemomyces frigidus]